MKNPPEVRPASPADAAAVASLAGEWGYPVSAEAMRGRLERLTGSASHLVLVAEVDGAVAGWATGEIRSSLGSEPRVEITGLVVAARHRRSGAGRALVAGIESWSRGKGCSELFLRSNVARSEAHPFYERLGFSRTKTQHAYNRRLDADATAHSAGLMASLNKSHPASASIRKLLPEDAAAFQAIRLRGLWEIPSAFTSSHAEEVDTPINEIARRLAPGADGAVLGAFCGNDLGGIIGVQREPRKQTAHKAFLWGMYVAPGYRREGIARQLVSRAIEIAKTELGVRTVNLGVNTRNEPAVRLYQSLGFRTYGVEPAFLMIDGELYDEFLMTRTVLEQGW